MSSQPARPLIVLDCDSTLIQDEVIELIADAAGTRTRVADITERAMRGELDFADSLRERVATLAGTPESALHEVYTRIRVSPGAPELIAETHARDGIVGVVSGGFIEVLDPLGQNLKLDRWRANRLEVAAGVLTGRLVGDIVDAQVKAGCLRQWASEEGIPITHTIAVGDGANDLLMMEAAAISVAYNAKPIVRRHADVSIEGDLSLVIPLLDSLPAVRE